MKEKLAKIGAFVAVAGMALTGLAKDGAVDVRQFIRKTRQGHARHGDECADP